MKDWPKGIRKGAKKFNEGRGRGERKREEGKRGGVASEWGEGEGGGRTEWRERGRAIGREYLEGQIGSLVCESMGSQSLPLAVSPLKL